MSFMYLSKIKTDMRGHVRICNTIPECFDRKPEDLLHMHNDYENFPFQILVRLHADVYQQRAPNQA